MCGICGLSYPDQRHGDAELVKAMSEAIRYRGPDSDGQYLGPGVGIASRRLAIIDVSGGDQPITNEDESLWIVMNGELYNYRAMRADLQVRGHRLRTQSDTECILHYYEDEGDSCVHRLRGMFAFALWDKTRRRLLVARDRLGKKPIYYTVQDSTLYFCSEMGGLLRGLPRKPEVDLEAIDLYLSLQYVPEPRTVYKDIFKLPAAHTLVWENGHAVTHRYWDYSYLPKLGGSEDELATELLDRVRECVQLRLISEVPLGAHLSGGLDSSIVVAMMAELSDAPVKTFSVGFEEEDFSELEFAREVATRYGTDHEEFRLSYGDVPTTLNEIIPHFGEPFADASAIPLYLLSRLTRQTVTVALNGDGGDEDFAGYERYVLDPLGNLVQRAPSWATRSLVPALAAPLRDDSSAPVGRSIVNGIKRLRTLTEVDPRASILRWGSYFSPHQRRALWKPAHWQRFAANNAEQLLIAEYERAEGSRLDRTLSADVHTYLPGDLLVKADRMTMAASLEGRSPFLDHTLVEWTARLPDAMKIRGRRGKYLLRRAFARHLPQSVQSHRKQGFGIPLGPWFRGPLVKWSRDLILDTGTVLDQWFDRRARAQILDEHSSHRVDHGKRIYALGVLALWASASL